MRVISNAVGYEVLFPGILVENKKGWLENSHVWSHQGDTNLYQDPTNSGTPVTDKTITNVWFACGECFQISGSFTGRYVLGLLTFVYFMILLYFKRSKVKKVLPLILLLVYHCMCWYSPWHMFIFLTVLCKFG